MRRRFVNLLALPSKLFVLVDIPAELNGLVLGAVLLLRSIFEVKFREVQRHMFHAVAGAEARWRRSRDDDVGELDLQVFERGLAGLADDQRPLIVVRVERSWPGRADWATR